MGLDMYLSARKYVKNWDHIKPEEKHIVTLKKAGKPVISNLKVKEVIYEAGYWRKANQIHNWFVKNVQEGEDDCKEYFVSEDQLRELLNLCKEVKAKAILKPAKIQNGTRWTSEKRSEAIMEDGEIIVNDEEIASLLPNSSGFFFGSTDYNQYYMSDIEETITMLTEVLEDPDGFDFYYQSSW